MLFVVTAIDKEGSLQLRMATREAHFAYVKATGAVRLGGPFLDESGDMAGSMIVIEAADLPAARANSTSATAVNAPSASPVAAPACAGVAPSPSPMPSE